MPFDSSFSSSLIDSSRARPRAGPLQPCPWKKIISCLFFAWSEPSNACSLVLAESVTASIMLILGIVFSLSDRNIMQLIQKTAKNVAWFHENDGRLYSFGPPPIAGSGPHEA